MLQGDVHHKLCEINLSFNKIIKIPTNTFIDLVKLIEINLADNMISVVEEGAFANLHYLTNLVLRGNKIININAEIFQNLPSLMYLDLAYNSIMHFTFASLDQVRFFVFIYFLKLKRIKIKLDLIKMNHYWQVGTLSTLTMNVSHNRIFELSYNSSFDRKYLPSYIKVNHATVVN